MQGERASCASSMRGALCSHGARSARMRGALCSHGARSACMRGALSSCVGAGMQAERAACKQSAPLMLLAQEARSPCTRGALYLLAWCALCMKGARSACMRRTLLALGALCLHERRALCVRGCGHASRARPIHAERTPSRRARLSCEESASRARRARPVHAERAPCILCPPPLVVRLSFYRRNYYHPLLICR